MVDDPEALLDSDWIETYFVHRAALHSQLVALHNEMYILRQIQNFPFRLFGSADNTFWFLTANALAESAIMGVWRLLVDNSPRALSLRRFKRDVLAHIGNSDARRLLDARWKTLAISRQTTELEKRIRQIRHEFYAHFSPQLSGTRSGHTIQLPRISISDLDNAAAVLMDMLTCLGLGTLFSSLVHSYEHSAADAETPDIIKLLEHQAMLSFWFTAPEDKPDLWTVHRATMSAEDLQTYNCWRVRLGKLEA